MTHTNKLEIRHRLRDGSIRLPFETDLMNTSPLGSSSNGMLDDSMSSSQTLVMDKSANFKPVHDEFISFVRSHDSISQFSFSVNDSADGNSCFEDIYDMGKVLGEGGFAFVYQCRHKRNQRTYAVKEVHRKEHTNGEEIRDEISALRRVKECPHFVRLLDVFEQATTTYLIMEEMKGGDLLDKLAEIEVYEEWEARKVARTLLEAVQYCHKRKIAHRDIKPENILLPRADDITMIKLADFGCARQWSRPNEMHTLCGSPQYVAPEVVGDQREEGEGYNCQCDLWSVGVVLYIILGGYAPFESEDENELLDLICNAEYEFHEEYWDDVDEPPRQLISQLLEPDPKQRLTARRALRSPWLRRRDGDWVKEMDESDGSTTFGKWLEKRNSSSSNNSSSHSHSSLYSSKSFASASSSGLGLNTSAATNNGGLIGNNSGHTISTANLSPTPSRNNSKFLDQGDSNHSLATWDWIGGDSNHNINNNENDDDNDNDNDSNGADADDVAFKSSGGSLKPGLMHDSSTNANAFNLADSSAE